MQTTICKNNFLNISLFAVLAIMHNSAFAIPACTTTSGSYSITSNTTGCYDWTSGDITINLGTSLIPSTGRNPISTSGSVGTLVNNGSIISNNLSGSGEPILINNNVSMISNSNTGLIQNQTSAFTVFVLNGTLSTLDNSGQIINIGNAGAAEAAIGVAFGSGVIANLNNLSTGLISTVNHSAIVSAYGGRIDNISNAGEIRVTGGVIGNNWGTNDDGSVIFNDGHITSITNTGSIHTAVSGAFGIMNNISNANDANSGIIDTLNNLQGASSSALTYSGRLPTNYNIIINSPTNFGKLLVNGSAGTTTFGIYTGSIVTNGTYASVLTGLTLSDLTATTGTYGSGTWTLMNTSGSIWDLIMAGYTSIPAGPSTVDTQASLHNTAQRLRSAFNSAAISTNFANMNTYDCNLFDTKGMCISVGGRYTTVDNPSSNSTSAVVVAGYKASPNIRIGGFLDQNVNNNTPTGIKVSNKNPLMGVFAVWNQNADGLGYQLKVANAYQDKDVNTSRDVIGTSEAGAGATNLNTQSYVGELSYAFTYQGKTLLRPYLALRHTIIKQDAYTETGVSTPLSYASLTDRSTTALVGLKLNHSLTPKTTLTASLGVEQDIKHSVDQYRATSVGISGLTSEDFNDSINRTRPVASAGAYYAASKKQRISGDFYYQQLPFQSTGSTTAYFNYMVGF